jgi:hypothetical protein
MATIGNQEQWKCRSCEQVFDTRGKRDAHHRKVHQNFTFERSGRAQVQRSDHGKFACECGKEYDRVQYLQRHRPSCYAAIAMIEGGENSSEHEEGTFPCPENWHVSHMIFSVLQCLVLHCLFCYELANSRTRWSGNGLG